MNYYILLFLIDAQIAITIQSSSTFMHWFNSALISIPSEHVRNTRGMYAESSHEWHLTFALSRSSWCAITSVINGQSAVHRQSIRDAVASEAVAAAGIASASVLSVLLLMMQPLIFSPLLPMTMLLLPTLLQLLLLLLLLPPVAAADAGADTFPSAAHDYAAPAVAAPSAVGA